MSEVQVNVRASSLPVTATFALVLTPLLYLRGWFRLRRCSPNRIPLRSLSAFITGFFLVWAATASPLAELDHLSLSLHMVKHLLLMTVAAPLILVGAPALPLLHGLSGPFIQSRWFLRNRTIRWIAFVLAHPLFCWTAATAVVIGWHLPVTFQLAMRSSWMHSVEDVCFLLAGLLFWRPLIIAKPVSSLTRSPRWSMALYLFLATLPCDILSAFLTFCNRLVYPCYLFTARPFGLSPVQDQECAGALMWVWVTFAYLIPTVVITMQILSPTEARWQELPQAAWPRLAVQLQDGSESEVL